MVPSETDGGAENGALPVALRRSQRQSRLSLHSDQVKAAVAQVDDRSWSREKKIICLTIGVS
jgi:hypothetical protein